MEDSVTRTFMEPHGSSICEEHANRISMDGSLLLSSNMDEEMCRGCRKKQVPCFFFWFDSGVEQKKGSTIFLCR